MSILALRRANSYDIDDVAQIVALAFEDDPIMKWTFRNLPSLRAALRVFLQDIYLKRGWVDLDPSTSGAAMWLAPGEHSGLSFGGSLRFAASVIPHAGIGPISRGLRYEAKIEKAKPKEPHLYLFAIGVEPSGQGKGIGSRLIQAGLRYADEHAVPTYLETSKQQNVKLYERYGFSIIDEITPAKDAPHVWSMLRKANTVAGRAKAD